MYNSESFGTPVDERKNGFYIGKQYLTITVNGWREDIAKGQLKLWELYEDPRIPDWYLELEFHDWPEHKKVRPTLDQMMKDFFG